MADLTGAVPLPWGEGVTLQPLVVNQTQAEQAQCRSQARGLASRLTCSACSSARWQSATAKDSVLFCCTPEFTDSRLFMLSNI